MSKQQGKTDAKSLKDAVKKIKEKMPTAQGFMQADPLGQTADAMTMQRAMADPRGLSPKAIPGLQRSVGNQYVQTMLAGAGQGQSADKLAARIQAQIVEDQQEEGTNDKPIAQRQPDADGGLELTESFSDRINQQTGRGGSTLPKEAQAKMKQGLGMANPDKIRVHLDPSADALNKSLGARAFTTGRDIFFRQGAYDPGTAKGQRLLFHEGAHTLQQGGTKGKTAQPKLVVNPPGGKYEQQADAVAEQAMAAPGPGGPRFSAPNTTPNVRKQAQESDQAAEEWAEGETMPTGVGMDSSPPLQMAEDEDEKKKKEEAKAQGDKVASETQEKDKQAKEGSKEKAKEKGKEKAQDKEGKKDKVPKPEKPKPPEKIEPQLPTPEPAVDSTEVKYDPEEEPEEPEIETPPRLPTWEELAEGTVQMDTQEVNTELAFHQQLATGDGTVPMGEDINVSDEATEAAGAEEVDRGEMIEDALKEGALAGFQEGMTSFITDQVIQAATSKIPYADGFINMAKLAHDPGKWAEENVLSVGTGAVDMVKGFKAIGDEDTAWGYMAATLEAISLLLDFVTKITGLINTIFTIILAIAKVMTIVGNIMISLAPTAPFCILCWMAAPGSLMVSIGSLVISFLEPVNNVVSAIGNILTLIKISLQPLIMLFRVLDMLETKADPEKLKAKQEKLKGATQTFVQEGTTRMANRAKDKAVDGAGKIKQKVQDRKAEKALEAPRKPTETQADYEARKAQAQARRDELKTQKAETGEKVEKKPFTKRLKEFLTPQSYQDLKTAFSKDKQTGERGLSKQIREKREIYAQASSPAFAAYKARRKEREEHKYNETRRAYYESRMQRRRAGEPAPAPGPLKKRPLKERLKEGAKEKWENVKGKALDAGMSVALNKSDASLYIEAKFRKRQAGQKLGKHHQAEAEHGRAVQNLDAAIKNRDQSKTDVQDAQARARQAEQEFQAAKREAIKAQRGGDTEQQIAANQRLKESREKRNQTQAEAEAKRIQAEQAERDADSAKDRLDEAAIRKKETADSADAAAERAKALKEERKKRKELQDKAFEGEGGQRHGQGPTGFSSNLYAIIEDWTGFEVNKWFKETFLGEKDAQEWLDVAEGALGEAEQAKQKGDEGKKKDKGQEAQKALEKASEKIDALETKAGDLAGRTAALDIAAQKGMATAFAASTQAGYYGVGKDLEAVVNEPEKKKAGMTKEQLAEAEKKEKETEEKKTTTYWADKIGTRGPKLGEDGGYHSALSSKLKERAEEKLKKAKALKLRYETLAGRAKALGYAPRNWEEKYKIKTLKLKLEAKGLPIPNKEYEKLYPQAPIFVIKMGEKGGGGAGAAGLAGGAAALGMTPLAIPAAGGAIAAAATAGQPTTEKQVAETTAEEEIWVHKGLKLSIAPQPVVIKAQGGKTFEFTPKDTDVRKGSGVVQVTVAYQTPSGFPLQVQPKLQDDAAQPGSSTGSDSKQAVIQRATKDEALTGPATGSRNTANTTVQLTPEEEEAASPAPIPQPTPQNALLIQQTPEDEEELAGTEQDEEVAPLEAEEPADVAEEPAEMTAEEEADDMEGMEAAEPLGLAMADVKAQLYEQLPPPPEGVIERIQGAALAYSEVDDEEYGLLLQQQQIGGLKKHAAGQLAEVQGTRVLTAAHQKGVAKQQADTEVKLQAQDQMAQASSAQEGHAQGTADKGGGVMGVMSGIFSKILQGFGLPIGGGSADAPAAKEGTKQQADQTQATSVATKDATKLSQQRTEETQVVKAEAAQVQDELGSFDNQMAETQAGTEQGMEELNTAQEANEEQMTTMQGEKERLTDEHASALEEAEAWAAEHRAIREEIMGQLEISMAGEGEEAA